MAVIFDIIKLIFYKLFTLLPIKKKLVVFESSRGLSYSCNPKYIYEGLLEYSKQYTCVWSFQDITTKTKGDPVKVKRFSLKYYYFLARAEYWIHNGEFGKKIRRRKGTTYINTQHGTPLKKMGIDIPYFNINKKRYDKTKKWDYLISPNAYTTKIFRQAYMYKGEILEIGYPRNDILYLKNDQNNIQQIKKKLKIPRNKKIILYAPTYRDYESNKKIKPKDDSWDELKLNLELLSDKISGEFILIIRAHHLKSKKFKIEDYKEFIFDFSGAEYDIQELYLISDLLITDYSSVMFDYANLNRPMLFFTYDMDEYEEHIRGLYLDFKKIAPGPLVYNNEELVGAIKNIKRVTEIYSQKAKEFYDKFCHLDNGNATKKILERLF